MARHLEDALDLERENEQLRSILHAVKTDLNRIRRDFLDTTNTLNEETLDQLDDELEYISMTVENSLF